MKKHMAKLMALTLTTFLFSGCGVQSIPQSENDVEAKWAEVQNQYKRRADLIPNLVEVVKGYAAHEKETLESVIRARSEATKITLVTFDVSLSETPPRLNESTAIRSASSKLVP